MRAIEDVGGRPARGEYFAQCGYSEAKHSDFNAPVTMARRLASYISDASTVRVRVLDQFGRAPKVERIRQMRAEYLRERELRIASLSLDPLEEEPTWFKPLSLVKPPKIAVDKLVLTHYADSSSEGTDEPRPDWREVRLITASDVIHACSLVFDVSIGEILGETRQRDVAHARHLAATILKARGGSYPQVAYRLNRGDHTTVMNSLKSFFGAVIRREGMEEIYDHLAPTAFVGIRTIGEFNEIDRERRAA